ncbi:MAG: hypothetical protein NXH75_07380, partial [Halobacteriovoraceae bacterium]|nr:hypothetical protein [Halobacteriovoraceae bacterium]
SWSCCMKVVISAFLVVTFILSSHAGDLYREREDRTVYEDTTYSRVGERNYLGTPLAGNPNAIGAWETAVYPVTSRGGTGYTIANDAVLRDAVFNPGADIAAGCVHRVGMGEEFEDRRGEYDITNEQQRAALVQQIMDEGPERHAKTALSLPGGEFDVFNDALTLPDGTYVNFTFAEAREVARRWGCRMPNRDQAAAIRRHAEEQDAVYTARPHSPNNAPQTYSNMTAMMNDPRMIERAEVGRTRLINGHFKWYIDDGSGNFAFYGFRYPSACSRTGYCQNGGSGGHGNHHIDYSQSVRLICPRGDSV